MKKTILMILVLLSVALLVACNKPAEEKTETTTTTDDGDTEITVTQTEGDNDEWCEPGASWAMSASGDEGDVDANWDIQGLITTGEFAGMCHVKYDITTDETQANIDYYFAEDGSGYMVMNVNGQTIKTEWTGE